VGALGIALPNVGRGQRGSLSVPSGVVTQHALAHRVAGPADAESAGGRVVA